MVGMAGPRGMEQGIAITLWVPCGHPHIPLLSRPPDFAQKAGPA
jgi:hypothetical protein